jgi:hypothetical protein
MKIKVWLLFLAFVFAGQHAWAQKSENREVSAFTEVSLRNDANVFVKQGKNFSVSVTGKESTLEKLITEVRDRKLVIRYPNESFFKTNWNPGEVIVYVTMPQIDGLSVSGSGNISSDGSVDATIIDIAVSGSGSVKLHDLKAEKVSATLSGSGNVILAGKEGSVNFNGVISGSGNIKAFDFAAKNVDVKIAGSGNCHIQATEKLIVKIAGSGNVVYRGNPAIDSTIAGSGSVREER